MKASSARSEHYCSSETAACRKGSQGLGIHWSERSGSRLWFLPQKVFQASYRKTGFEERCYPFATSHNWFSAGQSWSTDPRGVENSWALISEDDSGCLRACLSCTNCRLDGQACPTPVNRKRRHPRIEHRRTRSAQPCGTQMQQHRHRFANSPQKLFVFACTNPGY